MTTIQFYFWCQRNVGSKTFDLSLGIDERVPYWPSWVWIYSFLYYPMILFINLTIESPGEFPRLAISYVLLLGLQMIAFRMFPVATPAHWRNRNRVRGMSERFLAVVQRFDDRSNCFPSMHCSVAMLTALHLLPHLGPSIFIFPALIGLSCLFTKQHFVIDVPFGIALGWGAYELFLFMIGLGYRDASVWQQDPYFLNYGSQLGGLGRLLVAA
jgi:membrane-associated phospholipid phosphatase